jgi:DNA-binding NarL/FixJ family response regulator
MELGENPMLRVLIVEDNRIFREAFKKGLLDYFPFMVIEEAASSDGALQKIKEDRPQLIFMDIRLPGINGLQLTQRVKKDFPNINIAILTDYDLPEYREAAVQYGADRFYVKNSLKWDEIETLVQSISPGAP